MKAKLITGIFALLGGSLSAGQPTPPSAPGHATLAAAQAALEPLQNRNAASAPSSVESHLDLVYTTIGNQKLTLDLYLPKASNSPTPCLVFVHGGAWFSGSKEEFRAYALHFASKGYACASISYRLAPASTYPGALEDVRAALDWVGREANLYHIDSNRMAIIGASAGGHLAMLAAYQDDCTKKEMPYQIRAVINLYGPCDLTTDIAKSHPAVIQFLGTPFESAEDRYEEASPVNHLDPNDPPTLVVHGTLDEVVPIAQSDALVKKFEALGIPHYYDRLPGWSHVMDLAPPVYERSLWLIEDFLKSHLPEKRLSQN